MGGYTRKEDQLRKERVEIGRSMEAWSKINNIETWSKVMKSPLSLCHTENPTSERSLPFIFLDFCTVCDPVRLLMCFCFVLLCFPQFWLHSQ